MNLKYYAFLLIGSIILSFLLYANTIKGEFVYDDHVFVNVEEFKKPGGVLLTLKDPYFISKTTTDNATMRPLTSFTFALNFALFGKSAASFHIVNILLNGFASFLVFIVVYLLFRNKRLSFISALLFLFLPIHTEAVASIKARDEILSAIFILLSWILFIKATYFSKVRWLYLGLSAFVFSLAVFSKEFAITAPFLFLFVFYIQHRPRIKKIIKIFSVFLPAYFFYLYLAGELLIKIALGKGSGYFIVNPLLGSDYIIRFWTAFKIAFLYISKTVFPINLSASYDYNQLTLVSNPLNSWATILGIFLLGLLLIIMFYKKTVSTPIGIGAAIFLISYVIYSKFIVVGGQIMAERWVYFASIGICLLMAVFIEVIYKRNKISAILLLIVILSMYSIIIIQRNTVWLNEKTLFESMVNTSPNSIVGHKMLSFSYLRERDYERALPHIEESMRIYIGYEMIGPMIDLLSSYDSKNQTLGRVIVKRGGGEVNSKLLALSLAKDRKYEQSLKVLDDLIKTKPEWENSPIALFTYGINYYKLGQLDQAEKYFQWVPGENKDDKIKYLEAF